MTMAKTSAAAAMRVLLAMADGEEEKMPRSNLDLCQWIPYLSLLVRICPFLGCLAYKTALSLLSLAHTIIPLQRLSLSPCLLSLKPLDLAGMRRRWAPRTCTTVAGTCFFDRTDQSGIPFPEAGSGWLATGFPIFWVGMHLQSSVIYLSVF
jgi:hypothetical protein